MHSACFTSVIKNYYIHYLRTLEDVLLSSHLRMEGKYYILGDGVPYDRHTHVIFHLDDGTGLRYHDTRKFGRMEILAKDTDLRTFHGLGPEPFSEEFSAAYIYACAHERRIPVKSLLLDQSFVAGIGNIYADEILFAIRIHPLTPGNCLDEEDMKRLIKQTRQILKRAIKAGGTTIRSYTSSLGVTGRFQLSLSVHTMEKCPLCDSKITKIAVGGRGTYFCEKCQVLKS